MRVTSYTRTSHTLTLDDDSEVDLDHRPSEMHHYSDILAERVGNTLLVGYLVDDHDAENPLENCDGMGKVIGRGKYANPDHDESEMFEALGLNRDGDKNYDNDAVLRHLNTAWDAHLDGVSVDTMSHVYEELFGEPERTKEAIAEATREMWDIRDNLQGRIADNFGVEDAISRTLDDLDLGAPWSHIRNAAIALGFDFETAQDKAWEQAIEAGEIGDPDAVVLDVYDHSGIAWSISGGGMQCRWDTSTGAGVWVPDASAREEIDRRGPVYATHQVREAPVRTKGGGKYQLLECNTDGSSTHIAFSDDWGDLFKMAQELHKAQGDLTPQELAIGRRRAARELAGEALDQYNAWLSGCCYGVVIEQFELANPDAEPEQYSWVGQLDKQDACWGYIGSLYTLETLRGEFNARLANIKETVHE